eukprot:CAMPEP_0197856552 /NCGR_PEP_ID=MMETSP1438-20131217/28775_1 /TAXON_ID=1461541 /ORGANISM="Pterosperma sp., Strain CCMP1384" /LENGTH=58 /DNA_ID=CAMNT_0043472037 /DNA_START=205 /DNA_END=381 /DNA_ORIENTATION=-
MAERRHVIYRRRAQFANAYGSFISLPTTAHQMNPSLANDPFGFSVFPTLKEGPRKNML